MNPFKSGGKLHWIKNLYWRYRYGAGCCDTYNLDHWLAKKMIKPIKCFRARVAGYPMDLRNFEEWESILDKIIWAFEYKIQGEDLDEPIEETTKKGKKMQEGFELFGKYFNAMWI